MGRHLLAVAAGVGVEWRGNGIAVAWKRVLAVWGWLCSGAEQHSCSGGKGVVGDVGHVGAVWSCMCGAALLLRVGGKLPEGAVVAAYERYWRAN